MPSFADIYANCLYASGEGLPLWNPSPLRLGDVGYVRDGSFIVLYNAVDGPGTLSDAASIHLARRSDDCVSRDRDRRDSSAKAHMDVDNLDDAASGEGASSRRSSLTTSSVSSAPTAVFMSRAAASDSVLPSVTKKGSPTLSHRKLRSGTPPEGPFPPMPLSVDQETPKLFDMGPRMSSNYRCLGLDVGASVPGTPASVKIGFESSGGDGAILIPRDPTERTRLKYLGVLKAYIKAHHRWMYETYGRIEAVGNDELALIYGQDRTSDWAVAVSRDAARGARVEFEVFGTASTGFWGNWSHTLSACQRGPHRPPAPRRDCATRTSPNGGCQRSECNVEQIRAPQAYKREPENRAWGMSLAGGVVNASFSFSSPASEEHGHEKPANGSQSITWPPEMHVLPDQTISIRRVTACTSLGLGFLPARPKAAAEPREPDFDAKRDRECAPIRVRTSDESQESGQSKQWCDDPLEALHEWIHDHGGAKVKVSVASDDDCLQLLSLLGDEHAVETGLQKAIRAAASQFARIWIDETGFATVSMDGSPGSDPYCVPVVPISSRPTLPAHSYRAARFVDHGRNSSASKEGIAEDMFAAARRATSVSAGIGAQAKLKPRAMQPSSRSNPMLACRPIRNMGTAVPSLVLP